MYTDSLGYSTIGVGCLVDPRVPGAGLPEPIIDALLEYQVAEKTREVHAALPWVAGLDEVRHAVVVDMAFNLGVPKLLKFKTTLTHLMASEWDSAAASMLDSLWAKQVGHRAVELSEMVRSGEWPARYRPK